jgi:DNA (cytosine-5)-methyltransferase 1
MLRRTSLNGKDQTRRNEMMDDMTISSKLTVLEICAGAGGQSVGLEQAGFGHSLAVEIDKDAAATLRLNRPSWDVHHGDVREVNGKDYKGIDLP